MLAKCQHFGEDYNGFPGRVVNARGPLVERIGSGQAAAGPVVKGDDIEIDTSAFAPQIAIPQWWLLGDFMFPKASNCSGGV